MVIKTVYRYYVYYFTHSNIFVRKTMKACTDFELYYNVNAIYKKMLKKTLYMIILSSILNVYKKCIDTQKTDNKGEEK